MESVWQTNLDMLNAAFGEPWTTNVLIEVNEAQPSLLVTTKVIE